MVPGRRNQDFFANAKAPGWSRFQNTYRAMVDRQTVDLDDIISLAPEPARAGAAAAAALAAELTPSTTGEK